MGTDSQAKDDRPTKVVPLRELARNTGRCIDDMNAEGVALLIVRRGTPVARMLPVAGGLVTILTGASPGQPVPMTERELAELKLTDNAPAVLAAVAGRPTVVDRIMRTTGLSLQDVAMALVQLEMKHLVVKRLGVYELTGLGRRAVLGLQQDSD